MVGAGPSGISVAYSAAKNGVNVALLEKDDHIAKNVRTSGITWISDAEKFGIPSKYYNKIKNYAFYSPNNHVVISGQQPKIAVLDIRRTYKFLTERALRSGVDLFVKTNVNKISLNKYERTVCSAEKKFYTKIIVDASGFKSVVAQLLGLVNPWIRFGVGAEYEAYAENVDYETWSILVGDEYSTSGYAWIFPVSNNVVRIGVGVGRPQSYINPIDKLKKLIEKKSGPIRNLGKITPIELHYGLIPNDGPIRSTVYDNLILVGDSAGYANPLVLEGIRYAIQFGITAGKTIAKAIKINNYSKKILLSYEKHWKKLILKKIDLAYIVQNRWLNLTDDEWDEEINIMKNLSVDELMSYMRADFGIVSTIKLAKKYPNMVIKNFFSTIKETLKK